MLLSIAENHRFITISIKMILLCYTSTLVFIKCLLQLEVMNQEHSSRSIEQFCFDITVIATFEHLHAQALVSSNC